MWIRALIVLLLVLNVGVAAWWATRAPAPPVPQAATTLGVARLQLATGPGVASRAAVPSAALPPSPSAVATEAPPAAVASTPAPAPALACYRYGPFADAAAAAAARARLQPLAQRARVLEQAAPGAGSGWRVLVPPLGSLQDAQAMVQRLAQAGFDDFLIVRDGAEANAIALGRYGREDAARRRAQALVDAGFPARAEPLGVATTSHWLDIAAGPAFDAARARAAAGVGVRDVDCASLR